MWSEEKTGPRTTGREVDYDPRSVTLLRRKVVSRNLGHFRASPTQDVGEINPDREGNQKDVPVRNDSYTLTLGTPSLTWSLHCTSDRTLNEPFSTFYHHVFTFSTRHVKNFVHVWSPTFLILSVNFFTLIKQRFISWRYNQQREERLKDILIGSQITRHKENGTLTQRTRTLLSHCKKETVGGGIISWLRIINIFMSDRIPSSFFLVY